MKTFLTVLLIAAILLIECLIGGTRLVFALPSYGLIGLAAFVTLFRRPDAEGTPDRACLAVTTIFFAYILGRAAFSPIAYLWWTDFFMVLACLAVYFITAIWLKGMRQRAAIIGALLALAIVEVFIGLHQFTAGDNWLPFGFIRAESGRRASGMLISSIHLAGYLEAIGIFGLSFAIWSTWKTWTRILAGYIALMCYLGIAITGSRGGYLSALFSLLVFSAISLHAAKKTRPARFAHRATIAIIAVIAALILSVLLMNRSELLRARLAAIPAQLERNTLDIRIYNWQAALDQFRTSPAVGTGAGTHIYYGRYFRRPPLQSDPIHAHSDYLELLAEYGLIGLIGIAVFITVHLRSGWRSYRAVLRLDLYDLPNQQPARHNSLALHIGALGAIAAYLAHSVVDFNLHIPGHALIFAFIFGTLASPMYGAAAASTPSRLAITSRWFIPALGTALLLIVIRIFPAEYWTEKARVAFRDYRFDHAIIYAEHALTKHPHNPELFFTLGGAHRGSALISEIPEDRLTHLELAADAYERGLALFPQDEHTLIRLAQTMDDLGRFKAAADYYLAAIALDKNLAQVHAFYARHLAIVGRAEEAEQSYATAYKLSAGTNIASIVRGTSLDPATKEP